MGFMVVPQPSEPTDDLLHGLIPRDGLPLGINPTSLLGLGSLQGREDSPRVVQYLETHMSPGADLPLRDCGQSIPHDLDGLPVSHLHPNGATGGAIQTGRGNPFHLRSSLEPCLREWRGRRFRFCADPLRPQGQACKRGGLKKGSPAHAQNIPDPKPSFRS